MYVRSPRAEAGEGEMADARGHGGGQVEHVHGAASPDRALDELAPEWVMAPVLGRGRHHVGVPEQGERRCRRVGSPDPGHQRGPPWLGLVGLHVDPRTLEVALDELGAAVLLARGDAPVVDAPIADELLEKLGRLLGTTGVRVHAGILRPVGP